MTAQQYNQLATGSKADLLWPDGEFLDHRTEDEKFMVVIYKLYNLFVEVFFDITSKDIINIKAIESEEDYDSCLKSVNLAQLMR